MLGNTLLSFLAVIDEIRNLKKEVVDSFALKKRKFILLVNE